MIQKRCLVCSILLITLISITLLPAANATDYTVAPTGAEFTSIHAAINRYVSRRYHFCEKWDLPGKSPAR